MGHRVRIKYRYKSTGHAVGGAKEDREPADRKERKRLVPHGSLVPIYPSSVPHTAQALRAYYRTLHRF
eukprot:2601570-Rhodomonas_salina.2